MIFSTKYPNKCPMTNHEHWSFFYVESLYTNIDHDLGLDAEKHWIEQYKEDIPDRFSISFIGDCITLIIQNNTFHFNGKYYTQKTPPWDISHHKQRIVRKKCETLHHKLYYILLLIVIYKFNIRESRKVRQKTSVVFVQCL